MYSYTVLTVVKGLHVCEGRSEAIKRSTSVTTNCCCPEREGCALTVHALRPWFSVQDTAVAQGVPAKHNNLESCLILPTSGWFCSLNCNKAMTRGKQAQKAVPGSQVDEEDTTLGKQEKAASIKAKMCPQTLV